MILISGVLKGPYGDPRSGVTIAMRSLKTSASVLSLAKSQSITDDGGKYSLNVEPGAYEVIISVYGTQPERIGMIEVYADSLPGTLNDFLRRPGENDITPEIVQTVDRLRAEATTSAQAAKQSEKNAELSVAKIAGARFRMPSTGTSSTWFLLGTVKGLMPTGDTMRLEVTGSAGYNAQPTQNGISTIVIRTGTGGAAVNKKGRASATIYQPRASEMPIMDATLIESTDNTYDIYVQLGAYTSRAFYTVQFEDISTPARAWTHVAKSQSAAPTSELVTLMVRQWDDASKIPKEALDSNLFYRGECGLGIQTPKPISVNNDAESLAWMIKDGTFSQFFRNDRSGSNIHPAFGASILSRVGDSYLSITGMYQSPTVIIATGTTAGQGRSATLLTTANTTTDANGFIKKASPIARLTGVPEKMADDYLDGFTLAGSAAVNNEAEGVFAERVSVGIYKVTGSLGFAEEGWTIEVPQDVNGNRLCFVETAIDSDGAITLKVSKRRFDVDTAAIVAGEPMDIPEGRWIDLRLAMPEREITEELPPGAAQPASEPKASLS